MATRSLGTLTLDLVAKIGGFTSGMDQASRVADKRMREIEKRAYAFGHGIGSSLKSAALEFVAFAGVTLSVGAALESLKGAIDLADETRDLSIRLGVSTQVLSDFRYAAQQTGTDMDTLAKGMKILAKNAAAAINPTSQQAKIFDALGVSVTDAQGNLKNLADLVPQLADKFKGLEDGTTKAALAQALFGKSGLDLTEFLNSGSQGLDDFATKLRALGGEITPEAAANADDFNDQLGDLKTAFGGLSLQIASDLLPDLKELVSDLVDMTREGTSAGSTAHEMAEGIRVVGSVAASTATLIGGITEAVAGFVQQLYGYLQLAGSLVTLNKQLRDNGFANIAGGSGKLQEAATNVVLPHRRTGNVRVGSDLSLAPSKSLEAAQFAQQVADAKAAKEQQRKLQAALGNVTDPKAKTKHAKTGKSDAEREAEKVARAIEQMTKAQQDWEAEVAKTGNPIVDAYSDKLREITEDGKNFAKDGVPADKVKAFTDRMTELATTVRDSDIAKFQQEFDDQTAEMAARLQGPAAEAMQTYREEVRKLDEQLKTGAITITEYNARLAQLGVARDAPMTDVSKAIDEQIRLLGMSSDEQEIYNNLKAAGVDANSAWGQSIIANTEQLQKLREQTAFMEDVKASLSDAFGDFITGAKSAKDAFGDFADHVYQTALRWLADKAIQALFNGFGNKDGSTGATGSTGGGFDWGALISSFFGGGKAGGGSVMPGKFYEVGEYNRPEMLMSGGKQYMIPGNKGNVVPMAGGGGGGLTVNFAVQGRMTRETQTQAANRVARTQRLASARNG